MDDKQKFVLPNMSSQFRLDVPVALFLRLPRLDALGVRYEHIRELLSGYIPLYYFFSTILLDLSKALCLIGDCIIGRKGSPRIVPRTLSALFLFTSVSFSFAGFTKPFSIKCTNLFSLLLFSRYIFNCGELKLN